MGSFGNETAIQLKSHVSYIMIVLDLIHNIWIYIVTRQYQQLASFSPCTISEIHPCSCGPTSGPRIPPPRKAMNTGTPLFHVACLCPMNNSAPRATKISEHGEICGDPKVLCNPQRTSGNINVMWSLQKPSARNLFIHVYTLYAVSLLYIATSRGLKSDFNFRIIVAPTRKITISPSYGISRERRDSRKQSSATHGVNSAERTVEVGKRWHSFIWGFRVTYMNLMICYSHLHFIHIVPENACQQLLLALALTSKITPEMSLQVCASKKQYVTTGVHVPSIVTKLTLASGLQRAGWFWTAAAKECSLKRLCLFKDSHSDNVLVLSFCQRLSVRAVPVPGLEKKPPLFTKPKEMWNSPNSWKRKLHIHQFTQSHPIIP